MVTHNNDIVLMPYVIKITKRTINGETVWYANKWKNILLKLKFLFVKPKYLKNAHYYKNKPVNGSYYGNISIKSNEM